MEVMHRAIVKSRTLKPMPGEITNQLINDATLPVKIEAARRAIAECTDLPELLRYKSQAEGLAAAVRTMKEVGPAMIRSANEMMADAWRKGGELLNQYSSAAEPKARTCKQGEGKGKGKGFSGGFKESERSRICTNLGLEKVEANSMVRFANTPLNFAYKAAQNTKSVKVAARNVPAVQPEKHTNSSFGIERTRYGEYLRNIMNCGGARGLVGALSNIRAIDFSNFKYLTPDERKVVKAKITEIVELLDEMDRLCR
jgi:hypothetical protein